MTPIATRLVELADELQTAAEIQHQALHDIGEALDEWVRVQQQSLNELRESMK